jgi:hypothetical protein
VAHTSHSIEIGSHRRSRRTCIADGVGGSFGNVYRRHVDAQSVCRHLRHLGVNALAHFHTTVTDENRAIGVQMNQGIGLVQELSPVVGESLTCSLARSLLCVAAGNGSTTYFLCERHAVLGRNQCNATLLPFVCQVETIDLLLAFVELA